MNKISEQLIKPLYKHGTIVALLVFAAFWSVFLLSAGTVTSGYHLMDDHGILMISRDLSQNNVFQVMANCIQGDLHSRFRPVYCLHRVFSVQILGANFVSLSLLSLTMAVLTSWFLYMFARQARFGRVSAFLFVLLTFMGAQTAIWWRLGTNEPIGMFWLSIGLYFMARTIFDAGKLRPIYNVLSVLALIIATLSKEAFVVLLPAVVLSELILYRQHHQLSWIKTIKANLGKIALLATVCLVELAIIFLKVGTNRMGYAGVDSNSLTLHNIAFTAKQLFLASNPLLMSMIGAVFMVVLSSKIVYDHVLTPKQPFKSLRSLLEELFYVAVLMGVYITPQAVLYAKSGFYARYLIPGVMGFAFLTIYLLAKTVQLITLKALRFGIDAILVIVTLLTLAADFRVARSDAKAFAAEGASLKRALDTLASNTKSNDAILIVADPALDFEASISTYRYLTIQARKTNTYIDPIWSLNRADYSPYQTEMRNNHLSLFGNLYIDHLQDKSQIKAIFTYRGTDTAFNQLLPTRFKAQSYTRLDFENFIVYLSS
jgi:Dolichyl-phosphate-mannose-protein mannosyltransferase